MPPGSLFTSGLAVQSFTRKHHTHKANSRPLRFRPLVLGLLSVLVERVAVAWMLNNRLLLVVAMLSRASAYMVGGGSMVARAAGRVHVRTMALKTGIVGMPNVGKSTLFNALMEEAQAQAANFPFCTIEPNVGVVAVPDKKLAVLGEMNLSEKLVPTSLSFVDIAGLVEGASKGEGLGNKFLANIRECDAIVHTVRCFVDDNVIHVSGMPPP